MTKRIPISLDDLLAQRQTWSDGTRVVFTNGIFDLLHVGHLRYLEEARSLGDVLIVGLNSDTSTQQLKGPYRPLVPEAERAALLLGLRAVDYVTIFGDLTAERLVRTLRPDIYVKGGDYALPAAEESIAYGKELPEARIVLSYGGRVELIPYLPGHSTTELIARIVERYGR
jgi:rfaE bifunctional protein nucleotidyltransferase chain/domain